MRTFFPPESSRRARHGTRPVVAVGLVLSVVSASCGETPDGAAQAAGSAGRAGFGAGAGALGNGGSATSSAGGASAGTAVTAGAGQASAGTSAGTGTAGGSGGTLGSGGAAAGSAGSSRAGSGGASAGGASGTGASGGQANSGGVAGTPTAGSAGDATSGRAGAAGAGGTAGAPGDTERCEIANYDADDPPAVLTLSGNLGTHDPVVIEAHDRFYLFSTGDNLGAKTSTDLRSWQAAPEVWTNGTRPAWLSQRVPGVTNLWAPDISYFGGQYHLYYSASTFGENTSCIGHATRAALDSGSWTDRGAVVCSSPSDDWNAIDPNLVVDTSGKAWLSFGSFWGGIKMIELDAEGARAGTALHSLAARPMNGGALEAPFIVRRCGYYYLFVSFDSCCRGVDSTYNMRVGRATEVLGPYTDREGRSMLQGGGTQLVAGNTRYRGPGHNAVLFGSDNAYNVYHAYDADNGGAAVLRISELAWDDAGWPVSAGP